MLSVVEDNISKNEEVVKASGELVDNTVREAEVSQKVVPVRRTPLASPQRLVKKKEYGKCWRFINILK